MQNRKQLKYPPYYFLCNIKVSGKNPEYILEESLKIKRSLERNFPNFIILGPSTCSIFKINNIYSYNIILKYKRKDNLTDILEKLVNHYKSNTKLQVAIDFNPSQMF